MSYVSCIWQVAECPSITATLDRREALDGADYAINMVQIGDFRPATVTDFAVPKRFGLRQTIEVAIHGDEEVELSPLPAPPPVLRLPIEDLDQLEDAAQAPAGLFVDFAREGRVDRLSRFDVPARDVPAAGEQAPGGGALLGHRAGERFDITMPNGRKMPASIKSIGG